MSKIKDAGYTRVRGIYGKRGYKGCDQRFIVLSDLKMHKLIHSKVKNYRCDWNECEKPFIKKCHLNRHKLNHLGEDMFIRQWNQCFMKFT
jgi:uncharacterized Zn-finger protein